MKKILSIALTVLAFSLVFTLIACNGKTEENTTTVESGETKNASEEATEPGIYTELAEKTNTDSGNSAVADTHIPVSYNIIPDTSEKTDADSATVTGITSGAHFPDKTERTTRESKTTATTKKVTTTRRAATTTKPNQTAVVTATDSSGNLFTVYVSEVN